MEDVKSIGALKTEIRDRFGPVPEETDYLLLKIMLKVMAVRAGCKRLDLDHNLLLLQFSALHQRHPQGLMEMLATHPKQYRLDQEGQFKTYLTSGPPTSQLAQTKNILIEIARHVNHKSSKIQKA
jgi:transcription-repair coupling factor (superfamily II helicase)